MSWPSCCARPRRRTASTSARSASETRTGRAGTPATSSTGSPSATNCLPSGASPGVARGGVGTRIRYGLPIPEGTVGHVAVGERMAVIVVVTRVDEFVPQREGHEREQEVDALRVERVERGAGRGGAEVELEGPALVRCGEGDHSLVVEVLVQGDRLRHAAAGLRRTEVSGSARRRRPEPDHRPLREAAGDVEVGGAADARAL